MMLSLALPISPRPLCRCLSVFFSLLWCIYTVDLPGHKRNTSCVWQLWLWPLTYEMFMNRNIATHSDVRSQTPAGANKLIIINNSLCITMRVCVRRDGWTASHHFFVWLYRSLSLDWHFTAHFFSFHKSNFMNTIQWPQKWHKLRSVTLERNTKSETFTLVNISQGWFVFEWVCVDTHLNVLATKKLMKI